MVVFLRPCPIVSHLGKIHHRIPLHWDISDTKLLQFQDPKVEQSAFAALAIPELALFEKTQTYIYIYIYIYIFDKKIGDTKNNALGVFKKYTKEAKKLNTKGKG